MCFLPWAPSAPPSPCSFPCSSSVQSPLRSLEKFLLLTLRLRVRLAFLHEVHFEAFGRFDLLGYIGHSAPDPQPSLHPLLFHVLAPLVRRRARRLVQLVLTLRYLGDIRDRSSPVLPNCLRDTSRGRPGLEFMHVVEHDPHPVVVFLADIGPIHITALRDPHPTCARAAIQSSVRRTQVLSRLVELVGAAAASQA